MADFCKQCSIELFNEDFKDLAGLGDGKPLEPNQGWEVICEGCGPTLVNDKGTCINKFCLKEHGMKQKREPQ